MATVLLAAPMIARGLVFVTGAPRPWTGFAWTAAVAFAIFWIWHSPAFYDETLRNNVVNELGGPRAGLDALSPVVSRVGDRACAG